MVSKFYQLTWYAASTLADASSGADEGTKVTPHCQRSLPCPQGEAFTVIIWLQCHDGPLATLAASDSMNVTIISDGMSNYDAVSDE